MALLGLSVETTRGNVMLAILTAIFPGETTQTFPVQQVFIDGVPAKVDFIITNEMPPNTMEVTAVRSWFAPAFSCHTGQNTLRVSLTRQPSSPSIKVKNTDNNYAGDGGIAISGVSIDWQRASPNVLFKRIDREGRHCVADINKARVKFTIRAAPGISYEYHR